MSNVEIEVRRRWATEGKDDLLFHDILFNKAHFEHHYARFEPFLKGKVLDLGAGCCWFGMLLKQRKPEVDVVSLDVSKDMMDLDRRAAEKMGIPYIETTKMLFDGKALPFPDKSFDCIFFSAVWHHIQDLPTYFKEVRRVLKDDGAVIAINEPCSPVTPGLRQYYNERFGHETRDEGLWEQPRTPGEYTAALQAGGFTNVSIKYDRFKIKRNWQKMGALPNAVYTVASIIPPTVLNRFVIGGSIVAIARP
ncbi:MAG: class I SAM-dependent methyltransferase [Candidatus Kerfeldbacteria bacterium]|nr:class I SAM-dependent methyltransferase [Candidatus Kerfeldbacteria bacterium]